MKGTIKLVIRQCLSCGVKQGMTTNSKCRHCPGSLRVSGGKVDE